MTVRPRTVRAGVTSFAMLAGLACYVFLAQWHVDQVLAGVLGFIFALLVRVAAASLTREWLAAHSAPPATGNGARGTRRTTKP